MTRAVLRASELAGMAGAGKSAPRPVSGGQEGFSRTKVSSNVNLSDRALTKQRESLKIKKAAFEQKCLTMSMDLGILRPTSSSLRLLPWKTYT